MTARKVTALITRPGPAGPELLVFDHGLAGVQIPAGTVEDDETFEAAALREAWEETGALGLELVRELAVLRTRGEERHLFHLRSSVAMPDDWRVATPDGGGVVWWCSWTSIDDAYAVIHEYQRDWLDATRPALDKSALEDPTPRPRPELRAELGGVGSWEEFWAYPFADCRFLMAFDDGVDPRACTRARGLCVTDDGLVVVIAGDHASFDIPGGGREPGETIEETLAREVWEEACCRVVDSVFLAALRGVKLDERGAAADDVEHHALFWARVEVATFEPMFETRQRRLVAPQEAIDVTTFPETTRLLLDRAASIDPRLEWNPE
jgi:8-oxo-dGTP pyrophosphatase MutT (NUDIX family)